MPRLIAVALALFLVVGLAHGDQPEENWYIVQMQGKRCGWMREGTTRDGENWKSQTELQLKIKRDAITISIALESTFVETDDGKPVSMSSNTKLGALPQPKEYKFLADGVEVTETPIDGKPTTSKQPLPSGEWLTPRAAETLFSEKIAAGAREVSIRSVDPSMGLKPVTSRHTLLEKSTLEVVGKAVPALKWKSTVELDVPMTSTDFTDERGRPLRTETDIGGLKLTIVRADRDLALAKLDAPELLVSTMIHPDKPIKNPRVCRQAVYQIQGTGEALADLPTQGIQKFERTGPASGRLTVDLGQPQPAPADQIGDAAFTGCSTMVTCADEQVKDLAARALAGKGIAVADKPARAEVLRKFVYRYINKKSLDVGFASAAEVARTKTGDCSEHGVLLCALLRADGIPSRVVAGIVYVDGFAKEENVFGYHMWTQALLDTGKGPRWTDLDATLDPDHPFDATHIGLTTSSLGDDDMTNSLVRLAPLMGNLKIKVESAE